jgi:hypothetical protein
MNNEYPYDGFENPPSPLDAAVRAVLAEALPEDAIERVKTRARQMAQTSTVVPARMRGRHEWRWRASRPLLGGLALVAALLVFAMGISLVWDHSGGQAFAQMIERVKAAGSVCFTTAARFGRRPEIEGKMYLAGNRLRLEQFDGTLIQVADLDRKQALYLDVPRKLAQLIEIDASVVRHFANPIDQLRRATSNDAQRVGEETLNGRLAQVYRLRKEDLLGMKGNAEMLVWVDAESELPAKIAIRDSDPKAATEIRFENFVWNEPLDARRFSLNVPDGFQPGTVMTAPPRGEPAESNAAAPAFADGVLRDRVPARILFDPRGTTITAVMQDPESVPPVARMPDQLRQWDVATGRLRWSETVAGSGWVAGTTDGRLLATVIGDEIQLRDAASGKVARKWATDEHLSPLAFSPDSKTLAAGITEWGPFGGGASKASGGVQFWDVEQARLVRSIADDRPVTFIKYSVDGKHLATSANNGPVKLWAAETGQLSRMFSGRMAADFSPDGKNIACVAAASAEAKTIGRVDLYNVRDGSLVRSFTSETGLIASWLLWVTFSPDGRLLVAADWNRTVTLWDVESGERKQTITDHLAGVRSLAFTPDGATLATGSEDQTLRLWRLPAKFPAAEPATK